jgi:hypothetical protein
LVDEERLTIGRTATGYWVVQRGSVDLAGALTRKAAEAERELRERLHNRGRLRGRRVRRPVRR